MIGIDGDYKSDSQATGGAPGTEGASGTGSSAGLPGLGGSVDRGGASGGDVDAGDRNSGGTGAGAVDAGAVDRGGTSGGDVDAGAMDRGGASGGDVDAGAMDRGGASGGDVDAGAMDRGGTSGGDPDASTADANTTDAGDADASDTDGSCASCAYSIDLTGQSETAMHGDTEGGDSYTDRCPDNEVIVGYSGTSRDDAYTVGGNTVVNVSSLLAICGVLSVEGTGNVIVTPNDALPLRGVDGDVGPWLQICPIDEVVVGFAGHAGAALDQIAFVCAPLSAPSFDGGSVLEIGITDELTPAGGDGGTAFEDGCPEGQVARGQILSSADWIYSFGLVCSTPQLTREDGGG